MLPTTTWNDIIEVLHLGWLRPGNGLNPVLSANLRLTDSANVLNRGVLVRPVLAVIIVLDCVQ